MLVLVACRLVSTKILTTLNFEFQDRGAGAHTGVDYEPYLVKTESHSQQHLNTASYGLADVSESSNLRMTITPELGSIMPTINNNHFHAGKIYSVSIDCCFAVHINCLSLLFLYAASTKSSEIYYADNTSVRPSTRPRCKSVFLCRY